MRWEDRLLTDQRPALDWVLSRSGSLLMGEVGSGKTYVAMAAIDKESPKLVMIVSPLTSLDITWAPKLAELDRYIVCRSLDAFRDERKKLASSGLRGCILLINFERAASIAKKLKGIPWDLVIIDEAQGLKARSSGWSRMSRRLRQVKRRIAMTATPIDDTPIDFFGIMRFVNSDELGLNFSDFADDFCRKGGYRGYKWIFRDSKLPELMRRLEPYIYRLDKKAMNLKPMQVHLIGTDLLGYERRLYDRMTKDGVINVDTGNGIETKVIAPREVTKQVKLEQMTGGAVIDDYGMPLATGSAKKRKLAALFPRVKLPVVIFCKYIHELAIVSYIFDHEPYKVRLLMGKIKGDDRTKLIQDFQAGKIDVLICQVRTGGVSIEFTRSSSLIFYSMTFSMINFEQIIGRFHRGGQKDVVNVWVIYAKNTVDEQIISAIKEKRGRFYVVVKHFEERRKK